MAFFDHLKEKFTAFVSWIAGKFRHGAEIVKISGEKQRLAGEIRRYYEELGRTIYKSKGQDTDACREICEKIDECSERLEAIAERDVLIRSRNRCPRCGEAMPKKAKFCSACGAAMPEEAAVNKPESTEE